MRWLKSMKALPSELACLGAVRLPGSGPRNNPSQWLKIIDDMAMLQSVAFYHSKAFFNVVLRITNLHWIFYISSFFLFEEPVP